MSALMARNKKEEVNLTSLRMLGTSPQMGFAQPGFPLHAAGKSTRGPSVLPGKWGAQPLKGWKIYLLSIVPLLSCLINAASL